MFDKVQIAGSRSWFCGALLLAPSKPLAHKVIDRLTHTETLA